MLLLLGIATAAHAEAPAYAGVGLGLGVAGPFVTVSGVVMVIASISEKPVEAWTLEDMTPEARAERARRRKVGARWAVAGGTTAILGAASTIAGPPLLLTGGLLGSGERSRVAGWTGVGLYGVALTATGVAIAAQDSDAAGPLVATAAIAYVGSLVAGGVQLAIDGGPETALVLPLAAGTF